MPYDEKFNDSYFTKYKKFEYFEYLSGDISSNDKNFIVHIFNDLYEYLESININDNSYIITFLYQKLIKSSDTETFITNIDELIFKEIIDNYFGEIMKYYKTLENDGLKIFMHQYIEYFMFKIILLLYSYYFYINKIILYKDNQPQPTVFYPIDIIKTVYPNIDKLSQSDIKPKLFNVIINSFKEDILHIDPTTNTIVISLDDIIYYFRNYIKDFDKYKYKYNIDPKNTLLNNIHNYILKLYGHSQYQIYAITLDKYKSEYITIPQYMGNCWYISMLTGMCYSDASKNLILSKNKEYLLKEAREKSSETFINIIYFIINNVTEHNKKYGDNDEDTNCEIFKYFKNNLMNYIYEKYNELNESTRGGIARKNELLFYGTNNMYFKHLNNKINFNKTILNDNIAKTIKVGLRVNDCSSYIINTFYNILNITTLYLFHHGDYNYFRQKNENIYEAEKTLENPDIIFLSKKKLIDKTHYESFTGIIHMKDTNNSIVLNGIIYKLDYILHFNDYDTCSKKGCGHCISGIHYKGVEYCYDSQYSLFYKMCGNDLCNIPCTLIKQDWSTDINKKQLCLYSIKKCFHNKISENSQHINKDTISEDSLCFNIANDLIYAYFNTGEKYVAPLDLSALNEPHTASQNTLSFIKPDEYKSSYAPDSIVISGGKNNTYKSIHKKVNILNNKTKTIIERTIYIDNNKNKFIRFNKKYEPLSIFKYNRNNKYFYLNKF